MAAYAQFGTEFPSASQLIGGVNQSAIKISTVSAVGNVNINSVGRSMPSTLSSPNDALLRHPCSSSITGNGAGPLSPGAISQTSNNTLAVAVKATKPFASTPSPPDAIVVDGCLLSAASKIRSENNGENEQIEESLCCDSARSIVTDPVSGQKVCSCHYDNARVTLKNYSCIPQTSVRIYGGPYASPDQNPYTGICMDNSPFYSPIGNPYGMKENKPCSDISAWTTTSLQQTTGFYSYDPTLAAYGYGHTYDLASRRKNATRESTATLKAWLNEHKKNPYPTKGEKIMLAIITKMTLTQVSTWFANARRRLKKENKMTWEPKNKPEDDDDPISEDEKLVADVHKTDYIYGSVDLNSNHKKNDNNQPVKPEDEKAEKAEFYEMERKAENIASMRGMHTHNASYIGFNPYQQQSHQNSQYYHPGYVVTDFPIQKNILSTDCGLSVPANKPKIWSLAETVACKTPPPTAYFGRNSSTTPQQHPIPQCQFQQQELESNLTPQAAHGSSLNMMSNFASASPYSRTPTTCAGPFQLTQLDSKLSGLSSESVQNQFQKQYRVGFQEIHPDTPPQTPPNIKVITNNLPQGMVSSAIPTVTNMFCSKNEGLLTKTLDTHSVN